MVSQETLNVALYALKELKDHCPKCGEEIWQESDNDECPCCGDELDKSNIEEIGNAIAEIEVDMGIRPYVEKVE